MEIDAITIAARLKRIAIAAHERTIDFLCPVVKSVAGALEKVDYKVAASKAVTIGSTSGVSAGKLLHDSDIVCFLIGFTVAALAFYLELIARKRQDGTPHIEPATLSPDLNQSPLADPLATPLPPEPQASGGPTI